MIGFGLEFSSPLDDVKHNTYYSKQPSPEPIGDMKYRKHMKHHTRAGLDMTTMAFSPKPMSPECRDYQTNFSPHVTNMHQNLLASGQAMKKQLKGRSRRGGNLNLSMGNQSHQTPQVKAISKQKFLHY